MSYPLRHLGLGERDRGEAPHPPEGACDRKGDAASPGSQGQGVTTPSRDLRRITTPPQAEQEDEHGLWAALPPRRVITLAPTEPYGAPRRSETEESNHIESRHTLGACTTARQRERRIRCTECLRIYP